GKLIATDDSGSQYLIRLRSVPAPGARPPARNAVPAAKTTPRQIQAYIRGGMSAADVAELTGTELADVERFEGPILAEREYVVSSALGVAVHVADGVGGDHRTTFGAAIRERLEALSATGERWASWREPEGGWIVKLAFTVDEIDHDARWAFDPRRRTLESLNPEATTLSQQDVSPGRSLIPRLRVVPTGDPDTSRFDSAAFTFDDRSRERPATPAHPAQRTAPSPAGAPASPFAIEAVRTTPLPPAPNHQTADLLAALRNKRLESARSLEGEGEPTAGLTQEPDDGLPEPPALLGDERVFGGHAVGGRAEGPGADDPRLADGNEGSGKHDKPVRQRPTGARRGRASIPSWDEIVFGARTDDDPA
ncbi:MAG TPA: septation protein SepH, partial [Microbacteriaceae bacterium]|nr:septation protein SepH [Microbacteriaceae bacterium]